jgi:hypothetical protein
MTPVDIMALLLVVILFTKLGTMFFFPSSLLTTTKKIYGSPTVVLTGVGLVMAGVTGYFLLQELSIVQVFACLLFFSSLTMIGVASFTEELISFAEKIMTPDIMKKTMMAWIVWVFLALWVLKELFI